jgi:hypothetical protein
MHMTFVPAAVASSEPSDTRKKRSLSTSLLPPLKVLHPLPSTHNTPITLTSERCLPSSQCAVGAMTEVLSDAIVGFGERWCSRLFAAHLRVCGYDALQMDASEILLVEPTSDGQSVNVDFESSNARLDAWADRNGGVPELIICTGFIASNAAGQVCLACVLNACHGLYMPELLMLPSQKSSWQRLKPLRGASAPQLRCKGMQMAFFLELFTGILPLMPVTCLQFHFPFFLMSLPALSKESLCWPSFPCHQEECT